jgi:hypothetical protein
MDKIASIASYTLKLFNAPGHPEFRTCLCQAVRYYNNGVFNHERACEAAKLIAVWRKNKRKEDSRQLSLF